MNQTGPAFQFKPRATHIHRVLQSECFEVFGSQPRSLLMPPVFWQFFGGFVSFGFLLQGYLVLSYQRITSGDWKNSCTHTHMKVEVVPLPLLSLFLFSKPLKGRNQTKENVCMWASDLDLGEGNFLSLFWPKPPKHSHLYYCQIPTGTLWR